MMWGKFSARTYLTTGAIAMATIGSITAAKAQVVFGNLWMYNGDVASGPVTLSEGESVYGACDADCDHLDLRLFDASNTEVSSDLAANATPVVTAPADGAYTLEITMSSCTHEDGCGVELSADFGL